jgi:hypothetical protein
LLGQATYQREAGELGIAIELGRQALGRWPGYRDAERFLSETTPQATRFYKKLHGWGEPPLVGT